MTKSTVTQAGCPCRDLVLEILTTTPTPLTFFQIRDVVRAAAGYLPTQTRTALAGLVDEELVDEQQMAGTLRRVYFLIGRGSRIGVKWIPASQVPPCGAAPHKWFSPLGLAA